MENFTEQEHSTDPLLQSYFDNHPELLSGKQTPKLLEQDSENRYYKYESKGSDGKFTSTVDVFLGPDGNIQALREIRFTNDDGMNKKDNGFIYIFANTIEGFTNHVRISLAAPDSVTAKQWRSRTQAAFWLEENRPDGSYEYRVRSKPGVNTVTGCAFQLGPYHETVGGNRIRKAVEFEKEGQPDEDMEDDEKEWAEEVGWVISATDENTVTSGRKIKNVKVGEEIIVQDFAYQVSADELDKMEFQARRLEDGKEIRVITISPVRVSSEDWHTRASITNRDWLKLATNIPIKLNVLTPLPQRNQK